MNLGGPLKDAEQTENEPESLIPMHLRASFLIKQTTATWEFQKKHCPLLSGVYN